MIIDSSALIAIMFREPEHKLLLDKMFSASNLRIGAATLVEATIVMSYRLNSDARNMIRDFIDECEIQVISFGMEHYSCASEAYLRFGKGKHKAALNFGDCLSYALAVVNNEPLLFIGNDFSKTDVITA